MLNVIVVILFEKDKLKGVKSQYHMHAHTFTFMIPITLFVFQDSKENV